MTADKLTIEKLDESDPMALYEHFGGELQPQPVYLELHPERGTVSVDSDPNVGGGVPPDVWHGRRIRWSFSGVPTPRTANRIMQELLPSLQRAADSYIEEWDGSNMVGRFPTIEDDDHAGYTGIGGAVTDALLDPEDCAFYLDPGDYFEHTGAPEELTAHTSDEQIEKMAERIVEDEMPDAGYLDDESVAKYLGEQRDLLRNRSEQTPD